MRWYHQRQRVTTRTAPGVSNIRRVRCLLAGQVYYRRFWALVQTVAIPDRLTMTLRIGSSTGTLFPRYATEDAVDLLASLGVADIEVMIQTHGECEPAYLRSLASRVRNAGVSVHSVHALAQIHPVFDAYERRAAEGWQRFEKIAEGAASMHAKVLVWHGLCRGERGYSLASPPVLEAIDRLGEICGNFDIVLGLENVSWCALSQVRDLLTMMSVLTESDHGDSVRYTFDAFQAAEADANPFMLLNAMESRLVNVHLRDFDGAAPDRRNLLPGEGALPWPALIRAIANTGYSGPLMLEGSLSDDPETRLAQVRSHLQPLIEESSTSANRCAGALPPGVLKGIELFNAGAFYECHEEIEHEWHAEPGEIRRFYQGILQIGVGFHHARGGNQRGAVLLLGDGIEKMAQFAPFCCGVDVAALISRSQTCLDAIQSLNPDDLPARFDWSRVPTIELESGRD